MNGSGLVSPRHRPLTRVCCCCCACSRAMSTMFTDLRCQEQHTQPTLGSFCYLYSQSICRRAGVVLALHDEKSFRPGALRQAGAEMRQGRTDRCRGRRRHRWRRCKSRHHRCRSPRPAPSAPPPASAAPQTPAVIEVCVRAAPNQLMSLTPKIEHQCSTPNTEHCRRHAQGSSAASASLLFKRFLPLLKP